MNPEFYLVSNESGIRNSIWYQMNMELYLVSNEYGTISVWCKGEYGIVLCWIHFEVKYQTVVFVKSETRRALRERKHAREPSQLLRQNV